MGLDHRLNKVKPYLVYGLDKWILKRVARRKMKRKEEKATLYIKSVRLWVSRLGSKKCNTKWRYENEIIKKQNKVKWWRQNDNR